MRNIILLFFFIFIINIPGVYAKCTGRFVNPITDLCWDCIFPISIGAAELPASTAARPDIENFSSPICICPNSKLLGLPTPGLAVGMWEPIRMVDVTKRPFCMTSIGGIELNPGISIGAGAAPYENEREGRIGNWQVHWYINPLTTILGIFKDQLCDEVSAVGFDLAYLTEFDPLWNNDVLAFILNPESILFGNILAQAACAADCIAATFSTPLDPLFWCAGCQGTMYPFTANNSEHLSSIQSSTLSVEKFTFKLHRQMMLPITSGPDAICTPILAAPMIKKSQYRIQTTVPVPGVGTHGCTPYGRSTILHDSRKEIPIAGEDFGYFVWRKSNCCAQ